MDQGGDKTGIKGVTNSAPKHGNEQGINKEDNGEEKTKVKTSSISSSVSVKPTPPAPAVTQGNGDSGEDVPWYQFCYPVDEEFLKLKGKDITVDRLIDLYHRGCMIYEYKYHLDQKAKDQMKVFMKEFGGKSPALIGFILRSWTTVGNVIFEKGKINRNKYGEPPKIPYFGMVMANKKLIRDLYNDSTTYWKQVKANQAATDAINESAPAGQLILSPKDIELYNDFRKNWPFKVEGFESLKPFISDKEEKAWQVERTLPFTYEFGQDTELAIYVVIHYRWEEFIDLVGESPDVVTVEFVCDHLKQARQVFDEYQAKQAAFKKQKWA